MNAFCTVVLVIALITIVTTFVLRKIVGKNQEPNGWLKTAQVIATVVALIMVAFSSVSFVPDGYVGMGKTMGVFTDKTYPQGFSIHVPVFQSIERVPVKLLTRELEDSYVASVKSSDDIKFKGSFFRVQFRLNRETAKELFIQYGNKLSTEVIQFPMIKAAFTSVMQVRTATEIGAGGEAVINEPTREALQEIVDRIYGAGRVEVVSIFVGEIQADELWQEYASNFERARKELEASRLENSRVKEIADNENLILIDRAKADAEREVIAAEAIAKANKLISESITQEIIDDKYAEATKVHGWYIAGRDSAVIVDGATYKERIPTE